MLHPVTVTLRFLSRNVTRHHFYPSINNSITENSQRNASSSSYFDDHRAPRVALTRDRKTIVMYHPTPEISYEDTCAIQRDDACHTFENVDDLVKERLEHAEIANKPVEDPSLHHMFPMHDRDVLPTVMELSKMFYTTKHRWFPNKAKEDRRKKNPPQDRPLK